MKMNEALWVGLRTASGVCSLFVSLHGIYQIYGLDFRVDTLVSTIYVVLPLASFFNFLFVKVPKLEVSLHAIVAIGYLSTFSILNWRTCAELGYCGSIASTVFATLKIKPVLAAFGVIVFSFAASFVDDRRGKTADHTSSK
jgi:hypothetical protein